MRSVKAEDAERFYEEDEDPAEVFAAFDGGEKGRTAPPEVRHPALPWADRLRQGVAAALRHLANAIESPHTRAR